MDRTILQNGAGPDLIADLLDHIKTIWIFLGSGNAIEGPHYQMFPENYFPLARCVKKPPNNSFHFMTCETPTQWAEPFAPELVHRLFLLYFLIFGSQFFYKIKHF